MIDPSPSVWRRASRNTAFGVSAVRIASDELQTCPPRVVRGPAFQPASRVIEPNRQARTLAQTRGRGRGAIAAGWWSWHPGSISRDASHGVGRHPPVLQVAKLGQDLGDHPVQRLRQLEGRVSSRLASRTLCAGEVAGRLWP